LEIIFLNHNLQKRGNKSSVWLPTISPVPKRKQKTAFIKKRLEVVAIVRIARLIQYIRRPPATLESYAQATYLIAGTPCDGGIVYNKSDFCKQHFLLTK
jgi:hypothetical protein